MRNRLLASIAAIGLSAVGLSGIAHAEGEGNGDPFPGLDASVSSPVGNGVTARSQDPFHYAAPTTAYQYGSHPVYLTRMQDPYQFHAPDRIILGQTPNAVAQAPASAGSVTSKAQGTHAQGIHETTHG